MSGKLKFSLELIGLGGLILSFPNFNFKQWTFYVAIISLLLALPFGMRSLKQKLQYRHNFPPL